MIMKRISKKTTLRILVSGLFLQVCLLLSAQGQMTFAGKWEIDHSKSDAEFKDYQVFCNIVQSASAISVEQIIIMKDGSKTSMPAIIYNLDGKAVTKEEQGGTNKISSTLSPDKRTLSTKFVRTMNGADYGSKTTYTLSADGKTLTVKTCDLKDESPMIQVYNRK